MVLMKDNDPSQGEIIPNECRPAGQTKERRWGQREGREGARARGREEKEGRGGRPRGRVEKSVVTGWHGNPHQRRTNRCDPGRPGCASPPARHLFPSSRRPRLAPLLPCRALCAIFGFLSVLPRATLLQPILLLASCPLRRSFRMLAAIPNNFFELSHPRPDRARRPPHALVVHTSHAVPNTRAHHQSRPFLGCSQLLRKPIVYSLDARRSSGPRSCHLPEPSCDATPP